MLMRTKMRGIASALALCLLIGVLSVPVANADTAIETPTDTQSELPTENADDPAQGEARDAAPERTSADLDLPSSDPYGIPPTELNATRSLSTDTAEPTADDPQIEAANDAAPDRQPSIAPTETSGVAITASDYTDTLFPATLTPDAFYLAVQTTENDKQFIIPACNYQVDDTTYDWTINWGDGTPDVNASGTAVQNNTNDELTHTFTNAGIYTITIKPRIAPTVPTGITQGWFQAFGMSASDAGSNTDSNREKIIGFDGVFDDKAINISRDYACAYMFYGCTNLTMGAHLTFDSAKSKVGNNFAVFMYAGCSGENFTMNKVFNLPQDITEVGDYFASLMFKACSGENFMMNKDFNLPQGITVVSEGFASEMFSDCSGAKFTMNDDFNLPQGIKGGVGDGFATGMFYSCSGENFTMNDDFNLPRGIAGAVGEDFASVMFCECSGDKFTMNKYFNIPEGITTAGKNFVAVMFRGCSGSNFTMNKVFTLPEQITEVGNYFAFRMFEGCSGANFTMNEVFNLPTGITAVSNHFAFRMFEGCSGANFLVNDVFMFPEFSIEDVDKTDVSNNGDVLAQVFDGVRRIQWRSAASIIGNCAVPTSDRNTFSPAFPLYDSELVDDNWQAGDVEAGYTIAGTVFDRNRTPVSAATVAVYPTDSSASYSAISDADGRYTITGIPQYTDGSYRVNATFEGIDGFAANLGGFKIPPATLLVAADQVATATKSDKTFFDITFGEIIYEASSSHASHNFGKVTFGYDASDPAAQSFTFTITNTGIAALTNMQAIITAARVVASTDATRMSTDTEASTNARISLASADAAAFEIVNAPRVTIAKDEATTVSVRPKSGLAVGKYSATLRVTADNGINIEVPLTFEVVTAGGGGVTPKTGDDTLLWPWITALLLAAVGIAVLARVTRGRII